VGYPADLIGHIAVDPPLNQAEVEYLTAFSATRRWFRPGGPYVVLDRPEAAEPYDQLELFNTPSPGEPSLRCDWVPSCDGGCITFNGRENIDQPGPWLRYLIDHFLKPRALASKTCDPRFAAFTFDHVLDGVVAACRRDTARLWLIRVKDNRVREQVLAEGSVDWAPREPFPYEQALDRDRPKRGRQRRWRPPRDGELAQVIALPPIEQRRSGRP
jgi:hypothetical protein